MAECGLQRHTYMRSGGQDVDGTMYQLPGGGFVGLRMNSESGGPAIDLNIPGLNIKKLHFPE